MEPRKTNFVGEKEPCGPEEGFISQNIGGNRGVILLWVTYINLAIYTHHMYESIENKDLHI